MISLSRWPDNSKKGINIDENNGLNGFHLNEIVPPRNNIEEFEILQDIKQFIKRVTKM